MLTQLGYEGRLKLPEVGEVSGREAPGAVLWRPRASMLSPAAGHLFHLLVGSFSEEEEPNLTR